MNWSSFLDLARYLASNAIPGQMKEAALRSSASRAYYAAFQIALEFVEVDGYQRRNTGEDHFGVRRHLLDAPPKAYNDPDKKRFVIRTELVRLYEYRRWGDYDYKKPPVTAHADRNASAAVASAEKILKLINQLSPGSAL